MTTDPDIGEQILNQVKVLRWITIGLALVLLLGVGYVYVQQNRTTSALCAFKNDLVNRNVQARDFLKTHPKGAFGFTPAQIQQSVDNYSRTVAALEPISCPPPV